MDSFGGLNCSSDLNTSEVNHSRARRLFEHTVCANQEVLNRVKERGTRSNNVAQIFKDQYNSLLGDAFVLDGELSELIEQRKRKTNILRKIQLESAYTKDGAQDTVTLDSKDADEITHRKFLQQLKETVAVRDKLIDEIHMLQKRNEDAVSDRAVLLKLVSEKEQSLLPLEKSADHVARIATSWKYNSVPSHYIETLREAIEQFVSWTIEEELAFRSTVDAMGKWNTSNDKNIDEALRIHDADIAVRFYQEWNDALVNILSHITHKSVERHEMLQSRIDSAQNGLKNKIALACTGGLLNRALHFHPFSQKDEEDLVRVVKTKPRHVLKHVRQQVWRSRKRELHFRNTVTHLMILLQEFLRKQLIDPTNASQIMEGVMEECVKYSQHDMAHLLFRAFLRFRKYGCVISVDALRYLFESYKENDSTELMLQLANEMRTDPALRPLCIAAYLFANQLEEAEKLQDGLSFSEFNKDDVIALISGYDKLQKGEKLMELLSKVRENQSLSSEDLTDIFRAFFRVCYRNDNDDAFVKVFQAVADKKIIIDPQTFAIILRHKMRHVTSIEEIHTVEEELKGYGYTPDVTGNSIIIAAYARLIHFGDRGSEELMLSKVDTLLSSIESRLKQGNPDMDISTAHIRAVIRGYGAAGRPESIKGAWERMQFKGLTNDVRVYNELIKWFALMGNVKDVIALKEEMDNADVHLDSQTYTWVIRALGKYYPRHVEKLYDEILEKRLRPDTQLYNTLLGTFGDLGDMNRVESLLEEMKQREESGSLQFTPITYAVLIRIYSNDLSKAEAIYEEAVKRGLADHPHVQTSMLHAYASHADDAEKLEAFLKKIVVWSTDIYNVLLNKYGKDGNKEKVEELLQKMKSEGVSMNDVTFGTLVTAFARWGETEKVQSVIQLLKDHEGDVSAAFYSVLASSLCRLGDANGVTNAWDDLISSKLFPDMEVYNQFLLLYSKQNNQGKMQTVLNNMMKHVPPNPVTATTILDMLGKSGRVTEMESLFEDMKSSPDTLPTSVTYHQMMNTYAKTGDVAKMEKMHEEFIAKGYTDNAVTYNILADGFGRSRRYEQMEEIIDQRRKMGIPMDDYNYCIIIAAYGRAKLKKEIHRIFADVTAAENHHVLTRRVLLAFIDAFCRCGSSEDVEKCVSELKRMNVDGKLTANDIHVLIPFFCRLGDMLRVEELQKQGEDMGVSLSYSALNAISKGYAKVGRFEKTVETLHILRDKNWVPDASTALFLSSSFLKAGLHEQAQQVVQWRRQYAKHAGDEISSQTDF